MKQFAFLFLSVCAAISGAEAEDLRRGQFALPADASIRGMSTDELMRTLGKPDSKMDNGNRTEWRYGNSLVFLSDGRVTAWSDSGDLQNRQLMATLRKGDQQGGRIFEPEGWLNAWQRQPAITSEEVVAELLRR